jgi:hypothetical protein
MTSMKRFVPLLIGIAGIAVLIALLRVYEPYQPQDIQVTRDQAMAIADRAAAGVGIDVSKSWRTVTWETADILDGEYKNDPALRRRANHDPIVGPRLGTYRVVYFHKGLEKQPNYGDVLVSGSTGDVLGARRRARNETVGANASEEQIRAAADRIVATTKFPGIANPSFDSIRPTVQRGRTDWLVRYRVPSETSTGRVNLFLGVYFIGDRYAGFLPLEEYRDGSNFRGEGSEIAGQFIRFAAIFSLLLWGGILFLKKYHSGEVGVRTASMLFAAAAILSILNNIFAAPAMSVGTMFGTGLDAFGTAVAMGMFKFLFYDFPLAVVVFVAWAVGESYARERWGAKLASFDALLRRDAFNATVGRSILRGLLLAPAVAAVALLVATIPVWFGIANPTITYGNVYMLALGGPISALVMSALQALIGSVAVALFGVSFFRRRRVLVLGIVAAAVIGVMLGLMEAPIAPTVPQGVFSFGAGLAAALIFLRWDVLTTATALFFGGVTFSFSHFLSEASGSAFATAGTAAAVPLLVALAVAIAGILTRRDIEYTYEDLAPHVKRIVERERVKAEIDAANRIQAALLPLDTPSFAGASVASHYRAASEIGGDYFDFLPQPTGEVGIAFGDVSGHGLTSGIVMAMAKSALLVQVGYDASPRAVLDVLNDIVIRTAPKRILMTFFFGLLDPGSQTLRFSSAGHHDPYVYRAATGKLEPLSSWGFPLGVRRRDPFREHSVAFDTGDKLILYSDGLIEAIDDHGEPYGFERFEHTIREFGSKSADDIKKALLNSVKKFTHNRPPEDDQTLVVVSFDEIPHRRPIVPKVVVADVSETVH